MDSREVNSHTILKYGINMALIQLTKPKTKNIIPRMAIGLSLKDCSVSLFNANGIIAVFNCYQYTPFKTSP